MFPAMLEQNAQDALVDALWYGGTESSLGGLCELD
jgi:hypothetical protein